MRFSIKKDRVFFGNLSRSLSFWFGNPPNLLYKYTNIERSFLQGVKNGVKNGHRIPCFLV